MNFVYKVCSKDEWDQAILNQFYSGSHVDNKDGFIHLSTKKQVNGTIKKYFFGVIPPFSFNLANDFNNFQVDSKKAKGLRDE